MLKILEEGDGKKLLDGYFNVLYSRGYIQHGITKKYVFWLFLMRLVNHVYYLLDDDDYNDINKVLICLFAPETWLMSYDIRKYFIKIEESVFHAEFSIRKTELDAIRRAEGYTNDEIRAAETVIP